MKKNIHICIICIISLCCFFSCVKKSKFPPEPTISYKSFSQHNTTCHLTLNFTDGDGDIGLEAENNKPPFDTTSYFYNNLFLTVYEKINGEFKPCFIVDNDTLIFKYRIKNIKPVTNHEYVKGEFIVEITDPFWLLQQNLHSDTIHFKCVLYDRALHPSNILTTPDIKVTRFSEIH